MKRAPMLLFVLFSGLLGCGKPAANLRNEVANSRPSAVQFLDEPNTATVLSSEDQRALAIGKRVLAAALTFGPTSALKDCGPIALKVDLQNDATNVLSTESLLTKLELSIRRNNIPIGTNATFVTLEVEGTVINHAKQEPDKALLVCKVRLKVERPLLSMGSEQARHVWANVWETSTMAWGGRDYITDLVPKVTEQVADAFAVAYLRAQADEGK